VFYGEYLSTVDNVGRVIIPAPLREAAREAEGGELPRFVMRFGEDGCVIIYTVSYWAAVESKVNCAPDGEEGVRRYRRLFFGLGGAGECDKQGRLRVPPRLLQAAGIERDVMIVGVSGQIEVWDRGRWEAYREEMLKRCRTDAAAHPTWGSGGKEHTT
jgi:MraZ protein